MSDSDLIRFNFDDVRLYGEAYRVSDYAGTVKPGDTVASLYLTPASSGYGAPIEGTAPNGEQWIYEIRGAFFDTWQTDHLGASNHCRMLEDYAEHVVITSYANGHGLGIILGSEVPESLVESVVALEDYPVYDETDYSRREWEGLEESLDFAIHDALNAADVRLWSEHEQDDLTDAERETVAEYVREQVREDGQWCREDDVRWADVERWALEQVTGLRNVPFA